MKTPEDIVRAGYDAAADRYAAQRDRFANDRHLERFVELLPPPATVLDVGCGSGEPIDRHLVDLGYEVTGIDISARQIQLARQRVPTGEYRVRDMLDLQEEEYLVDGVVSFYAIFHTPRDRHAPLLATLASFLRVGGVLLVTMGGSEWEGMEPDFHGVEMYWSHFGPERNRALVEETGLHVKLDEIDESVGERHQIILAQRM